MNTNMVNEILPIKSYSEILEDNTSPPPHIIGNGILLEKSLLMIVGQKKSFKSYLAFNMMTALLAGKSFSSFEIEQPCSVMLLSAEGGYYPNRDRLKMMLKRFESEELANGFINFASRLNLEVDDHFQALRMTIEEYKPRVLILDPLSKFHFCDENSASQVGQIMSKLRMLIEDYDLSTILVHHAGKDMSRGARGSSVLSAEYDSCISISKADTTTIKLSFDMRHVETPEPKWLRFNIDNYWFEDTTNQIALSTLDYIRENPGLDRSEIIEGVGLSKSTGYRYIDQLLKDGYIVVQDGNIHAIEDMQ